MPVAAAQRIDELVYGAHKSCEGFVVSISQTLCFNEPPDTLDQVEVWRVDREVEKVDPEGLSEVHDPPVSLVSRVVHYQCDFLCGVGCTDLGDQLADGIRVDRSGGPHADEVVVPCLHRAKDVVSLPPAPGRDEDPGKGPDHPQKGTHYEVGGINEKNPPPSLSGLLKPWQQLLVEKVELHLRIGLSGDRRAFLVFHSQSPHYAPGLGIGELDGSQFLNPCRRLGGGRNRRGEKRLFNFDKKGFDTAGGPIIAIFDQSLDPASAVKLEIIGDCIARDIEDFRDLTVRNAGIVHSDGEDASLKSLAEFRIIERLGNCDAILISKFELEHAA